MRRLAVLSSTFPTFHDEASPNAAVNNPSTCNPDILVHLLVFKSSSLPSRHTVWVV
jgi:hypothetical protein